MTQKTYKKISLDTLNFFGTKSYYGYRKENGHKVKVIYDIPKSLELMIKNTKFYEDNYKYVIYPPYSNLTAKYYVVDMSTIKAASILADKDLITNVGILNFASATKAGGGWLNGKVAQEEDIMRKTTVFPSLVIQDKFYQLDKYNDYYSDSIIYTPKVYIIKDDNFNYCPIREISVVTCAAINLTKIKNNPYALNWLTSYNNTNNIDYIFYRMKERMKKILYSFIENNITNIVLGAFGCGVFGHDAKMISNIWKELLMDEGYEHYFENVVFAILDNSPNKYNYNCFVNDFGYTNSLI